MQCVLSDEKNAPTFYPIFIGKNPDCAVDWYRSETGHCVPAIPGVVIFFRGGKKDRGCGKSGILVCNRLVFFLKTHTSATTP
jgi:hypothetical protein